MWWVTVTNQSYYETIRDDAAEGETNWTITRRASRGDKVLLYCTAPISAIVAQAEIASAPVRDEDPKSMWYGSWFSDMTGLRMVEPLLRRSSLLSTFPDWKYWKQPRLPTHVPEIYLPQLGVLLRLL